MGALMRGHAWEASALGPISGWTPALRSALSICLGTRFPIALYWGPRLALLYNDAWAPILGTKHPWALGRDGVDVWPEIWAEIGPLFERVLREGEATYSEDSLLAMNRHGYTEECYFNFTFSPIRGAGGTVEGVFNAVIETTWRVIEARRAGALERLGAATRDVRSTADVASRAIASLAGETCDVPFSAIYLVRDGVARLAAASPDGLRGSVFADEIPLAGDGPDPFGVRRAAAADGPHVARDPSGALPGGAWPEPAREAIVDAIRPGPNVAPFGVLVVGASPRRAVDASYLQFAGNAAASIARAMSGATAYAAERERAEILAQLDRAKSAFFQNISHEFRTPLTLMLGVTEEALDGGALAGDALESLHRNGLRLLRLVNSLLDFSRLEAGRSRPRFRRTELPELTGDLVSGFRSAVERAGLALDVRLEPLPEPLWLDRDSWEKIILNLLSNALKFTFEGSISVTLAPRGDRVALVVADTGTGIPEDELPRLFERFHRVAGARSRTHEGSGIGLALVKELVSLHGGTIDVESTPGVGTRFTVLLPTGSAHLGPLDLDAAVGVEGGAAPPGAIARGLLDEALRWLPAADAPAKPSADAPDARIVVADDNADMRAYVSRLLRPLGRVEGGADGREALAALRRERADVVVSDVMMPELDGLGLVRALRDDRALADVPVLLLSARAGADPVSEGIEAGATDYLVKPFAARELVARVRGMITVGRLRRELELASAFAWDVLRDVPVAIAVWGGPEHVFEHANREYERVFGRTGVVGRRVRDVFPEPELVTAGLWEIWDSVFATGEPRFFPEFEVWFERTPGHRERGWFAFHLAPRRDAGGRVVGLVAAAVDVSAQVDARQAIDELRVRAEEAGRAKDQFLAMFGHELRNPMAPIVTAIDLLRMRQPDLAGGELQIIERQVRHLRRLIDDVLDVSRGRGGKLELHREPVDVAAVVDLAIEQARPLLDERGHRLTVTASPGLVVQGDATRLAQSLANILVNAAKYTLPGGSVRVAVAAEGDRAVVRVRDSGIGIAPDQLERVFEPFHQEDGAARGTTGGLGLGLAIVRDIVRMHGGAVDIHSEGRGHGAEVTVRLPLAGGAPTPAVATAPAGPQVTGAGATVLVVDDNADAADLLAQALEMWDFDVIVAHDGHAALARMDATPPCAAIIDMDMPGMDGCELARRIRKDPRHGHMHLVVLTGYGQASDRAATAAAGFDQHLVKPVDLDQLLAVLTPVCSATGPAGR